MTSSVKDLYKIQIKYYLSPKNFVLAFLFAFFTYANFFIRHQFFSGTSASLSLFFSAVPYISIIILPALAAKTSINNFDDFVPYSSFQKLISRFLGLLTVCTAFILLLIPALIFISLFFTIDFSEVLTSFFFLLLYASCTISLCLLIFELVSNQITAFVLAAVLLALFNSAHNFTVYLSSKSFLAALFKEISFAWHFDAASKAIFDSRDFIFFLIFTAFFLFLTWLTCEKKKGRIKTQGFRIFLYAVIFLLVFLNSKRWYCRLDFSKNQTYSLSKYSKSLLSDVAEPLSITFYRSATLNSLYPQVRDVSDFLQAYASHSKNISFKIKNPDSDSKAQELLDSYGIKSQEIKNSAQTSTKITRVYSAVILEYNGTFEALPFVLGAQSLEYDLDMRVKKLISAKKFIVNVILGNGMTFSQDYTYLVPIFNLQGLEVNPLFPESQDFSQRLSAASGPLFVIGDSQIKIDAAIAIEDYILSGKGNAFFALSPYSFDIQGDWSLKENLNTNLVEMLENWGITFEAKIAGDISCSKITMVSGDNDETYVLNYPLWIKILPQINLPSGGLTLFWPSNLTIQNEKLAKAYITSSDHAFSYKASELNVNPFEISQKNYPSDDKGPKILGAEISGQLSGLFNLKNSSGEVKVIAISDQYFLNTLMNNYAAEADSADFSNFDFAVYSILYLMNESQLCKLHQKSLQSSSSLKIQNDAEGIEQFKNLSLITMISLFIIIPVLIAVAALLYFYLQKKKLLSYCKELSDRRES